KFVLNTRKALSENIEGFAIGELLVRDAIKQLRLLVELLVQILRAADNLDCLAPRDFNSIAKIFYTLNDLDGLTAKNLYGIAGFLDLFCVLVDFVAESAEHAC